MKLAKKFVSLAAALAMGTCVYTVPVFAEDESPDVPLAPVEETSGDNEIAPINEDGTPSQGEPISLETEENSIADLHTQEYVDYGSNVFKLSEDKKTVTTDIVINQSLPADLVYEISWPGGASNPSLKLSKAIYEENDKFKDKIQSFSLSASLPTPSTNVLDNSTTNGNDNSDETNNPSQAPQKNEGGVVQSEDGTPTDDLDYGNETETTRGGFKLLIKKDSLPYREDSKPNTLTLVFTVLPGSGSSTSNVLDLESKLYLYGGKDTANKEIISEPLDEEDRLFIGETAQEFAYSSKYDKTLNTFLLNLTVPETVYKGDKPIRMLVATYPDGSVLEGIQSMKIGSQQIAPGVFNSTFVKTDLPIPGSSTVELPTFTKSILLEIPTSALEDLEAENSEIQMVFNVKKDMPSNTNVYAYAATQLLLDGKAYSVPLKDEADYTITGVYDNKLNTWTVGVQPSASSLADGEGETTINITSSPNVMTKLNSLVIGSKEVLKDTTGESADGAQSSQTTSDSTQSSAASDTTQASDSTEPSSSNEVGEEPAVASLKKINNGYQIKVKNKDLQDLTNQDWIKAVFATQENFGTATMEVKAESGNYKSDTYEKEIKAEVGDTTNVTFKGSHDYDSTKQTWTVNLAMTGRPDKLDLTFTQTEGTALGKPTSITVDGTAVSPTVNTQMSGSTMSVCTVDFRKEDLDKIKADSKVTLVFPIDGSTEQSERILMNVDLGNSSKDLSAKFTVKKSSTSPSSSSNVHTATESGMSTMLVVAAVALAAFAVFGVLAFKKKKSK